MEYTPPSREIQASANFKTMETKSRDENYEYKVAHKLIVSHQDDIGFKNPGLLILLTSHSTRKNYEMQGPIFTF